MTAGAGFPLAGGGTALSDRTFAMTIAFLGAGGRSVMTGIFLGGPPLPSAGIKYGGVSPPELD